MVGCSLPIKGILLGRIGQRTDRMGKFGLAWAALILGSLFKMSWACARMSFVMFALFCWADKAPASVIGGLGRSTPIYYDVQLTQLLEDDDDNRGYNNHYWNFDSFASSYWRKQLQEYTGQLSPELSHVVPSN